VVAASARVKASIGPLPEPERRWVAPSIVSYIQIRTDRGQSLFGAGIDTNIELASIKAIISALNRALARS
ncbi:MAG: alpha-isopropylmalate synthase regulatory domain-containing protein, partial [Opitutaceae bacterium]